MKLNILVSGKNNQNETSMSEPEYNNIMKDKRNAEYLAVLDKSMAEAEAGRLIMKSLEELGELE